MSGTALPRALLASVLLLPLTACGGDTSTVSTAPASTAPAPAATTAPSPASSGVRLGTGTPPDPAAATADNTFAISFADGKATGDTGRLKVSVGDSVSITVRSLRTDEVHLHGYDLSAPVRVDLPAVITFDAKIPGVFELELEDAGFKLATLQVQ